MHTGLPYGPARTKSAEAAARCVTPPKPFAGRRITRASAGGDPLAAIGRRGPLALLPVFVWAMLFAAGCGSGGGGGTSGPMLQGKAAFRAAALASYQSLAAGDAYPFAALKVVAPEGSPIRLAGRGLRAEGALPRQLTFVPALNLYVSAAVFNGNMATLGFFTDAAGTQSAGSVVMTLPAGANGSVDYQNYPVLVNVAINLTGGNLPCRGTVAITFVRQSGANSMAGSLMIRGETKLDINLTLSDGLDVAGSLTVQENGATAKATHVAGNVVSTLHFDVSVDPYGWTGTGTINLITGQISLSLNTGGGGSTAASDALGHFNIHYSDGMDEMIDDPFTASLVAGTLSPDAGTGMDGGAPRDGGGDAGSGNYVMTTQQFNKVIAINNAGQIVGSTLLGSGEFLASPSGQGVMLSGGFAGGMNQSGQIAGTSFDMPSVPLVFSQPNLQKMVLMTTGFPEGAGAFGITDSGSVVGISNPSGSPQKVLYWMNATAAPAVLLTAMSPSTSQLVAVSGGGQIAAHYYFSGNHFLYWPSATMQSMELMAPPGDTAPSSIHLNGRGEVIANLGSSSYYWTSPSAQPIALPLLPGRMSAAANGINENGLIVGSQGSNPPHAVYWPNGQSAVDLNTLLPADLNWYLAEAFAVNDLGQVVCRPAGGSFIMDQFPLVIVTVH